MQVVAATGAGPTFTPSTSPRTRSSGRCWTSTRPATRTTTWPARSSRACAAATRTRRSTGWPGCSKRGEDPRFIARRLVIFASARTWATPTRGPAGGERRVARGRDGRPAGVPAQPGAGGHATWRRPRSRTPRRWRSARPARTCRKGRTLPVPKHLRDSALPRAPKQFGHGDGLPVRPRLRGRLGGPGVHAGGQDVLRADRPRLRGGDRRSGWTNGEHREAGGGRWGMTEEEWLRLALTPATDGCVRGR